MPQGGLYLAVFFRIQVGKLGHVKIENVLCASLRMNVLITSSLNAPICWAGLWPFFGEELHMLCYVLTEEMAWATSRGHDSHCLQAVLGCSYPPPAVKGEGLHCIPVSMHRSKSV